jgi:hypothetical protein
LVSIVIPETVKKMGNAVFANTSVAIYCEASGRSEDWNTGWKDYNNGEL